MNKENLLNLLRKQEITVSFKKKDGSTRIMRCTLKKGLIPEVFGNSAPLANENHITVYDVEAEGWRTLNLETEWNLLKQ